MEKTIKLLLRLNGDLVCNDVVDDKMAGFQSENNATTLEIEIPSDLQSLSQYIEVLAPNGDATSSAALTVSSGKISLALASSVISEQGRYAVQWVGRDLSTGKVVKSAIIALDVDPSINAISEGSSNSDFVTWATNLLNDLEGRVTTLEEGEEAEVHADSEFTSEDYIIVVSGNSGKVIKQGTKSIAGITSDIATAKSEAISTAASDATTKMNSAISTAASDATSKANAAQSAAEATAAADATSKVASEAALRTSADNALDARITVLENGEAAEVSADSAFGTDAVIIVADGATGKKIKSGGVTLAGLYGTFEATESEIDSIWEAQ